MFIIKLLKAMKRIIVLTLIIAGTINNMSAQIGVRVYNYRPTGYYGAIFKPTISAQIGYVRLFKKRVRPLVFFTILNMKQRMAELPITFSIEKSNGTIVYPGTQSFKRFLMHQAHAGIDFAFVKKQKIFVFTGASLIAGWVFIQYRTKLNGGGESGGSVSGKELGFQFRMGAEYKMTEHIRILLSANRNYYAIISEDAGGHFWSNDYGVGIIYQFQQE